jgi:hypothetical protein
MRIMLLSEGFEGAPLLLKQLWNRSTLPPRARLSHAHLRVGMQRGVEQTSGEGCLRTCCGSIESRAFSFCFEPAARSAVSLLAVDLLNH